MISLPEVLIILLELSCRWERARALPGAVRLVDHFHSHGVPLALASSSPMQSIRTKLSFHAGIVPRSY